jgi:hypothetical protein
LENYAAKRKGWEEGGDLTWVNWEIKGAPGA